MAANSCFFCRKTYNTIHICSKNPAANVYPKDSLSDWEVPYLNKDSPVDRDRIAQKTIEDKNKKTD
jgi:hypothetical protein